MKIIDLSREKGEIEIVLNTMQMARALGTVSYTHLTLPTN